MREFSGNGIHEPPDPVDTAASSPILDELRLVARLRDLAEFRQANLPHLEALCRHQGVPAGPAANDDIRRLIERGVAGIVDDRYRRAAEVVFGYGPGRWEALKVRGRRAADEFGIGYDAFRRRHSDQRPSHFDTVVAELAHSLEGLDTYARAGEQTPTRVRRRRKAAWGVAVAGLIVITALLLLALESWRDAGSTTADGPIDISGYCRAELGAMVAVLDEPGSSIWRCTYPDGSSSGPIDIDAVCANRFGPGFSERSEETSGLGLRCSGNVESSDACPIPIGAADDDNDTVTAALPILVPAASKSVSCGSSPVYLWYEAVVQELDFGGAGGGAVMVVQEAGVVLEPPEWTAYDRVRGLPPEVVGYPQGPVVLEDGFFRLDVDQGRRSALVARSRSGPFFWMPAVTYLPWLEQGGIASCLGMPTEDANLTQRRQRFENGEIAQRFSDQGIDIHLDSAC